MAILGSLNLFLSIPGPAWAQQKAPEPARPEQGHILVLSLKESVVFGLKNNLDITIEGFNLRIGEANVTAARAIFDPTAFAEIVFRESTAQNRSLLAANRVLENDDLDTGAGIRQKLPTGGNYELRVDNNRNDTNTSFLQSLNPAYNTTFSLTLTQPLLRNFGVDVNRTQIKIAQNNLEISKDRLRQRVMDVTTQVQSAYWDLVFALEDLEVQERSLRLARELEELNRARVRAGVAAPVEITQAQTEVKAREQDVIVAEKAVRDAEDQLKVVLNLPQEGNWGGAILPSDTPAFTPVTVEVDTVVHEAFQKRPEYQTAKIDIANRELNLRFARNQLLPEFSLEGSIGATGLGPTFGESTDRLTSGDFYNYSIGATLSMPIGNRAARSDFLRARFELEQAQASLRQVKLRITAEVREAVRQVETAAKRVDTSGAAVVLAKEQLRIERKRLEAGVSTTFEVLRLQRDLAVAQANEVRAVTDHRKALANLERASGTVLERHQIEL